MEWELESLHLHDQLCKISNKLSEREENMEARALLELIDRQTMEIQIAGERQCRKIYTRNLPFSLPISYWIHKKWAYTALARVAEGNCSNIQNAHRRAK